MKIAAAQIASIVGDIQGNLDKHVELICTAAQQQVDLIVFPEMSLSGYCRKEADEFAFDEQDIRLAPLHLLARKHQIVIIAGAPIRIEGQLYIGSFVLKPEGTTELYTKQFLHDGEELFFSSSFAYNPIIRLGEEIILLAICADIDHPQHPANAKQQNCTLYIPSIFFSKKGIDGGHGYLSTYAKEHSLAILMSNYCGTVWEVEAGGKSAFWDRTGQRLAALDSKKPGLLIAEKQITNWRVDVI